MSGLEYVSIAYMMLGLGSVQDRVDMGLVNGMLIGYYAMGHVVLFTCFGYGIGKYHNFQQLNLFQRRF